MYFEQANAQRSKGLQTLKFCKLLPVMEVKLIHENKLGITEHEVMLPTPNGSYVFQASCRS